MLHKIEMQVEPEGKKPGFSVYIQGEDLDNLAKIGKMIEYTTKSNFFLLYPVLKDNAKNLGFEIKFKAVGPLAKYPVNFALYIYEKLFSYMGRDNYINRYNAEVPND
jgi:hypothetical protein